MANYPMGSVGGSSAFSMPSWVGPVVAGAATFGGAYLGYRGQQQANAANAKQAKDAMDFEREMSNTSYQRAKADITAAGYNPALAYSKGGADTPSGKTADMKNALASFGGSAETAVNTFNNMRQTDANITASKAQANKTQAEATQINLESAARVEEAKARASSAGTTARFAADTFDQAKRKFGYETARSNYGMQSDQLNLSYNTDLFQRNKDVLWPLATQQLKQDLATSIFNTRSAAAGARLSELAIPTAENIAKMAQTKWGKNITPFLSDASAISRMLSIGNNMIQR